MSETYFITGGTGFVGTFLIRSLLERRPNVRLLVLVRAPDQETADTRCRAILEATRIAEAGGLSRITPVRGDLTLTKFGLPASEYENLTQSVVEIFHCAASIQFDISRSEAELVNVQGTSQILELIANADALGRTVKLHYLSTVYTAGQQTGLFREDDPPETSRFFNEYERSKSMAEQLVRQAQRQFPIVIYRPSQIVGDSRTGEIKNPGLFYRVIQFGLLGNRVMLPRVKGATFDLVSIDYVAEALEYISRQPEAIGDTFHLVAGPRYVTSVEEFIQLLWQAATSLRKQHGLGPMPKPRFVMPEVFRLLLWLSYFSRKGRKLAKVSKLLLRYLSLRRVYDDQRARKLLDPASIRPLPFSEYVFNLLLPFTSGLKRETQSSQSIPGKVEGTFQ